MVIAFLDELFNENICLIIDREYTRGVSRKPIKTIRMDVKSNKHIKKNILNNIF